MPRSTDARSKAIRTAARLFQEKGYAATGLSEIIERSTSPKGSFYFHFPGGKQQLAAEALTAAGEVVAATLVELAARAPDPAHLLTAFAGAQERALVESDYRRGCPIATVTLEMAAESDIIRKAADGAYARWAAILAEYLQQHGHSATTASALGEHIVATLEGALLLARARRTPQPLRDAAQTLTILVTATAERAS